MRSSSNFGKSNHRCQRRGAIAVLAALFMVAVLGLIAFAIDVGMIANSRTDLQQASDAAALAGAAELSTNSGREGTVARQYAKLNRRANDPLIDDQIQVEVGTWNRSGRQFTANVEPADAVRVLTRLSNRPMFFGSMFGTQNYQSSASAVATFQPRDIMLVLDYSGSMQSEQKIENLKASVELFCSLVRATSGGHDRVGFVKYSTEASLERELTFRVNEVSIDARQGNANGWTNIGDAMQLGINELQQHGRPRAKKLILLLTDGLANRPLHLDPIQHVQNQANSAAHLLYPIVSVSFGSDADQSLMAEVASTTRGVHFHVAGSVSQQAESLKNVFRKVAVNRNLQLVD